MINLYFCAPADLWQNWKAPLRHALDEIGLPHQLSPECNDPSQVDYLIYAPGGPVSDFSPFTRAKAVLGLWAGVEDVVTNPSLHIPLSRMIQSELRDGMVEWVVGHVLRYHLGMDQHILNQDGGWNSEGPPLARDRSVVVLGLGEIGQACASALAALKFNVLGWSRSQKIVENVTCFHGPDDLSRALAQAEILVLLLPLTAETRLLINANRIAQLPQGAVILNPGRGWLLDERALLDALETGQIEHATLDAFQREPLPTDHPFWSHPKITVTPHIAAKTRPQSAACFIAENIQRREQAKPLLGLVNRQAGY
ncbi:MAG: glyoxylate/hydroxypyruvate reductase A [Robiginitomaculum sp.]|nr:MAG: glyoxylate/hydroxypyruvate reductase A [Robiginitomaculum sp.]